MRDGFWSEILRLIGDYVGPTAMLVTLPLITWAAITISPYYRAMKRKSKDKS